MVPIKIIIKIMNWDDLVSYPKQQLTRQLQGSMRSKRDGSSKVKVRNTIKNVTIDPLVKSYLLLLKKYIFLFFNAAWYSGPRHLKTIVTT